MSRRPAWRALRTDIVRGVALLAIPGIAAAAAVVMVNEAERWTGRWDPMTEYLRVATVLLVPLAVALAAWHAGRDGRRRTGELLGTVSRPGWQHVTLGWLGVTAGALVGLVLAWLAGAALVAPIATYPGHDWWWTLAIAGLAMVAATGLGTALGRLVPGRLVSPVSGIATYVLLGIATYSDTWTWLTPSLRHGSDGTTSLAGWVHLAQAGWLTGLAVALLIVAASRRPRLATVPAAVAVVAAVALVAADEGDHWRDHPAARELVCSDDGGAEICTGRIDAFLLTDIIAPVRAELARWDGVEGGFDRAVTRPAVGDGVPVPAGTIVLDLANLISWRGDLVEESAHGERIETVIADAAADVAYRSCDGVATQLGARHLPDSVVEATYVVRDWVVGEATPGTAWDVEGERTPSEVALSWTTAEQEHWLGRYLTAAQGCEASVFDDLMEDLR